MPIEHIYTYLVHPRKGLPSPSEIGGTALALDGKLFRLLSEVYEKSEEECDTEISFNRRADGTQANPCRDLILEFVGGPTVVRGRRIAERLEKVTTHRSGLGLLFLIVGTEGSRHKVVISRFPADSGILAEANQQALTVEFLERVFMKSATAYKAALYHDESIDGGFWIGRAVDKQINSRVVQLSNYWIADFLDSDFRTTAAAGTRRLAIALRDAARKTPDAAVKSEIAAAVTLAGSLGGRRMSVREFADRFGLSEEAMIAVGSEIRIPSLVNERFQFDVSEFKKQLAYRSVELDTGGLLTAESAEFDQIFHKEILDASGQTVRYSTEGRVVSERLGRKK